MRNKILLYILFYFSFYHVSLAQTLADSNAAGKVKWNYFRAESNLEEVGKFENGKREGLWKFYTSKHILYKKEKYSHGIRKYTYIYNALGKMIIYIDRNGKVTKRPDCGC